jgi:YidC/Oxa1 family membrane protein insertase
MNKSDIAIVALLFALLLAWTYFKRPSPAPVEPTPAGEEQPGAQEPDGTSPDGAPPDEALPPDRPADSGQPDVKPPPPVAVARPKVAEQRVLLTNATARIALSSWGGGVVSAQLNDYREAVDEDSGPMVLDFSAKPALSLDGIAGLTTNNAFVVAMSADSVTSATITATSPDGFRLERTVTLADDYRLDVTDTFSTTGGAETNLPEHRVSIGPMQIIKTKARSRGFSYLGVDTLSDQGGAEVFHWGKKVIPGLFGARRRALSCAKQSPIGMPTRREHQPEEPVSWAAAKNKFFVQILAPDEEATRCRMYAQRDAASSNSFALASVSAELVFAGRKLAPDEPYVRTMSYYVGPKKYAMLRKLPNLQADVMQFGFWAWFRATCKGLLLTLNAIYAVIPNYGVAIILLTIIVKMVFWPITHKSTESMKKMQSIKPEVDALREKYKDDAKRIQQETMLLYRQHGVNPLAGCLPMVVQIPVFIALFTVLRSAVELRFAEFLWIQDLSEPEGLLQGLPFIGSLNILPIFMTASMMWQQQLTPSGGDPQQKRMMMFMPAIMLMLFYNMASALVLYWSVSQALSIVQLLMQRRKKEK